MYFDNLMNTVPDALTLEKKFMAFNQKCEFMDFRQFSE
jgi:hypothetical protein